ncbi:unnamed protein product [Vitrella brassicaformis CCMP3155]|uniref:Uncharacterized protein n=1 Tax=Vitrella brassicaformis (strain CCMP3155) TaxID=1169540 RepID=A0A0G4GAD0_VITBC|nr:unnamed protein product [Vitrella brassicaformis CCMP3155]|eukprot:CEM25909.1 unnamed protein product [Vitrella brassicaformis CCMP3155]
MYQLLRLLSINHMASTMEQKAVDVVVVPVLVEQLSGREELESLVSSPDDDVRTEAIEALCNVTKGSVTGRDAVVAAAGVLEPLLKAMRESSSIKVLARGVQLLFTLWSVRPPLPPLAKLAPFVPILASFTSATDEGDRVRVMGVPMPTVICWSSVPPWQSAEPQMRLTGCLTMAFVTGGSPAHLQAVIDPDLFPLLVDAAVSAELSGTAARTIGRIVARGSQRQIEHDAVARAVADANAGRQKQANWMRASPTTPTTHKLSRPAMWTSWSSCRHTRTDGNIAEQTMAIHIDHFTARVDAQRLEALIQAGVIHVVPEPGGGEDDRATHVSDSDSGSDSDGDSDGDEEADGQLYGNGADQEE